MRRAEDAEVLAWAALDLAGTWRWSGAVDQLPAVAVAREMGDPATLAACLAALLPRPCSPSSASSLCSPALLCGIRESSMVTACRRAATPSDAAGDPARPQSPAAPLAAARLEACRVQHPDPPQPIRARSCGSVMRFAARPGRYPHSARATAARAAPPTGFRDLLLGATTPL